MCEEETLPQGAAGLGACVSVPVEPEPDQAGADVGVPTDSGQEWTACSAAGELQTHTRTTAFDQMIFFIFFYCVKIKTQSEKLLLNRKKAG